jgi:hypothetical protein
LSGDPVWECWQTPHQCDLWSVLEWDWRLCSLRLPTYMAWYIPELYEVPDCLEQNHGLRLQSQNLQDAGSSLGRVHAHVTLRTGERSALPLETRD